jgi:uncharacterized protein (TIGR02266 family)
MMGLIENRRFERLEAEIEVDFRHGHESFVEFTLNVSAGGLFIKTDYPRMPDDVIHMRFTLPDQNDIQDIKGVVRWSNRDAAKGPVGMGIEYVDLSERNRQAILQFIVTSQMTQKGF